MLQRRAVFFAIGILAFLLLLWVLRGILLPFVAALAVAYILDPFADGLEKRGLSRLAATSLITGIFMVATIAGFLLLMPLVYEQVLAFVETVPTLLGEIGAFAEWLGKGKLGRLLAPGGDIQSQFESRSPDMIGWILTLLGSLWNRGFAVAGLLSLAFVMPVVAFYLLLDWDRMVARINELLPRDHAHVIRSLAREIDEVMAGFVRGQGAVCLLLGLFYAVGLSLVGLQFGLIVGLVAGFISFIPYVGSITGLVVAGTLAVLQFWPDYTSIALVTGVFVTGQFIEGNFLTPKLVGSRVGLHPVWIMFALFAFGALFGFVGLLLAVPVTAAIGVLIRFAIDRYTNSTFYRGTGSGA